MILYKMNDKVNKFLLAGDKFITNAFKTAWIYWTGLVDHLLKTKTEFKN